MSDNCNTAHECNEVLDNKNFKNVVYVPVPGPPGPPGVPGSPGLPGKPGDIGKTGDSLFEFWKKEQNKPNATVEEFYEFFRGNMGPPAEPLKVFTVYKVTITNQKPERPNSAYTGWSVDFPEMSAANKYVWISFRYQNSTTQELFSEPTLYAVFAESGIDGKDGADIEFIYKLSDTGVIPEAPATSQEDDFVPVGWSDDPISPTPSQPFEMYCMRTKYNNVWSEFSAPSLWAKYSADGTDGKDGDNIEFVFIRTPDESVVPTIPTSQNVDKYVPPGHTSDPVSVTEVLKIQWGFKRTKNSGFWSAFSAPFIYTKFAVDGKDGKDTEYIYKRSTVFATPATPVAPSNQTDESIPEGWSDDSAGVSAEFPYEYRSLRKRLDTGLWGPYTSPKVFSKWAFDGTNGIDGTKYEYIFKRTQTTERPVTPVAIDQQDDFVPQGWSDDAMDLTDEFPYRWRVEREKNLGIWGAFKTPTLDGVKGKDGIGIPGQDGFSIAAIYAVSTNPNLAPTITKTDLLPNGWLRVQPTIVAGEYLWKSETCLKSNGEFLSGFSWSAPYRVTPVDGQKGDPGKDGTSVTIKDTLAAVSNLPLTGNPGDAYLINGDLYVWQQDTATWKNVGPVRGPQGLPGTPGGPGADGAIPQFQYSTDGVSGWRSTYVLGDQYMRIKLSNSNTWGPAMKMIGEKGKDGNSTVVEYSKNTSASNPPTSNWSSTRPSIGEGEYIWVRIGSKDPDNNITWQTPIRMTGTEGRNAPISVFRGEWDMTKTYVGKMDLVQVVLYGDTFYRTTIDAGSIVGVVPNLSPAKWVEMPFYENIATGFLYADSASILNLTVNRLFTATVGKRVEIDKEGVRITHENGVVGINIKTNNQGLAEIVLNNMNGVKILSLGANGVEYNTLYNESWKESVIVPLSPAINNPSTLTDAHKVNVMNYLTQNSCKHIVTGSRGDAIYILANTAIKYYLYTKGNYADGRDDTVYEGYHTAQVKDTATFIPDGWYLSYGVINASGRRSSGELSLIKVSSGKILLRDAITSVPDISTFPSTACVPGLYELITTTSLDR